MRLSTTTNILSRTDQTPPERVVFKQMELCRDAGFQHLDLHLSALAREGFPLAQDGWERWIGEVGDKAARLGVTLYQGHSFHYTTRESTDMRIDRAWYEERFRRSILAAHRLGIRWIVMHPCDFNADPEYDFDKARRFNLTYWKPFVEMAARLNVGIAFENLFASGRHARYCSQADELIDLVDTLGDPHVGICWDTGHAYVAGQNQPQAIRKIGSRLKAMHIHDNHGLPRGDEHLLPYFGTVDWPPILEAIHAIGYDNNFSLEVKQATYNLPPELCGDMLRFMFRLGEELMRMGAARREAAG